MIRAVVSPQIKSEPTYYYQARPLPPPPLEFNQPIVLPDFILSYIEATLLADTPFKLTVVCSSLQKKYYTFTKSEYGIDNVNSIIRAGSPILVQVARHLVGKMRSTHLSFGAILALAIKRILPYSESKPNALIITMALIAIALRYIPMDIGKILVAHKCNWSSLLSDPVWQELWQPPYIMHRCVFYMGCTRALMLSKPPNILLTSQFYNIFVISKATLPYQHKFHQHFLSLLEPVPIDDVIVYPQYHIGKLAKSLMLAWQNGIVSTPCARHLLRLMLRFIYNTTLIDSIMSVVDLNVTETVFATLLTNVPDHSRMTLSTIQYATLFKDSEYTVPALCVSLLPPSSWPSALDRTWSKLMFAPFIDSARDFVADIVHALHTTNINVNNNIRLYLTQYCNALLVANTAPPANDDSWIILKRFIVITSLSVLPYNIFQCYTTLISTGSYKPVVDISTARYLELLEFVVLQPNVAVDNYFVALPLGFVQVESNVNKTYGLQLHVVELFLRRVCASWSNEIIKRLIAIFNKVSILKNSVALPYFTNLWYQLCDKAWQTNGANTAVNGNDVATTPAAPSRKRKAQQQIGSTAKRAKLPI